MKQAADETSKGYSIVVTLAAARSLKNFALSPIMIKRQVEEDGTVKQRPLRDVSRPWSSWEGDEVSVNELIDMKDLRHRAKVRCAEALPGVLLALLEMVSTHPGEPISLAKADVGSCFFRFHTRLDQVPLFASLLTKDFVLLPLRQVQGSRSSPSFCPILTEAVCSMFSESDLSAREAAEACPHREWVREEIDERPQRGFPFRLKNREGRATAGHHAEAYVDDALLAYLAKDYEAASTCFLRCLYKAYRPCTADEDADFRPSPAAENKRDDFVARGVATFLGLVVDARELTVTISQSRADSIAKLLEEVFGEEGHWVEAWRLPEVTGRLTHASSCRIGGRAEMSAIWRILSCCPVRSGSRGKYYLQLLPEMRKRVEEWKAFLASPVPMPLCYVPQIMDQLVPSHIGYTDASGLGMGGFFVANRVVHVWRLAFPTGTAGAIMRKKGDGGKITINELELLGIVCQCSLLEHVLRVGGGATEGSVFNTFCDNQTAVIATNKLGFRSSAGLGIIRGLYEGAARGGYVPTAVHVAGVLNVLADYCSRKGAEMGDEELSDADLKAAAEEILSIPGRNSRVDRGSWDSVAILEVPPDIAARMNLLAEEAVQVNPWPKPPKSTLYYGHIDSRAGIVKDERMVSADKYKWEDHDLRED